MLDILPLFFVTCIFNNYIQNISLHMYVCMCVYMYICMCIYWIYVYIHICTHTHTHIYVCIYIYIYNTCVCRLIYWVLEISYNWCNAKRMMKSSVINDRKWPAPSPLHKLIWADCVHHANEAILVTEAMIKIWFSYDQRHDTGVSWDSIMFIAFGLNTLLTVAYNRQDVHLIHVDIT